MFSPILVLSQIFRTELADSLGQTFSFVKIVVCLSDLRTGRTPKSYSATNKIGKALRRICFVGRQIRSSNQSSYGSCVFSCQGKIFYI